MLDVKARRKSLHPIIEQTIEVLRRSAQPGEKYRLDAVAGRQLENAIGRIEDTGELAAAIVELMQFAWFLEKQQSSPQAAGVLWGVAFTMDAMLDRINLNVV